MFLSSPVNQISFLVIECFSFCIFLLAICLNRGDNLIRLMGLSFLLPLACTTAAFLDPGLMSFQAARAVGQLALTLVLMLLLVWKPGDNHLVPPVVLILLIPVLLLGSLNIMDVSAVDAGKVDGILAAALTAFLFAILFTAGRTGRALLLGALFLLIAALARKNHAALALVPETLAFILFFIYFFGGALGRMLALAARNEKRLSQLEQNIEQEVKRRIFALERFNKDLLLVSKTDSLTKAYNKAATISIMDNLILTRVNFAIILFDVDNFKEINDTLGHVAGDVILKKMAYLAKNCIREIDSLGRYGGDEFIIILPKTNVQEALFIAERFRHRVEEMEPGGCTVSIGIACYPVDASTTAGLIAVADEGLYISKRKGRNTVSHRDSPP